MNIAIMSRIQTVKSYVPSSYLPHLIPHFFFSLLYREERGRERGREGVRKRGRGDHMQDISKS